MAATRNRMSMSDYDNDNDIDNGKFMKLALAVTSSRTALQSGLDDRKRNFDSYRRNNT